MGAPMLRLNPVARNFNAGHANDKATRRIIRLGIQLIFVIFLFSQVSRPTFWAGLMGKAGMEPESNAPPGTRLIDPIQKPAPMPAGMFLASQNPAKNDHTAKAAEPAAGIVPPDENQVAEDDAKAVKTPVEDLPFLLETLVDLDRDLPPALYYHFLDKARQAPTERLLRDARRNVTFSHLYRDPREAPRRYRGQLLGVSGTVRRALEFDIPPNAYGLTKRYELWIFTEDSGKYPWVVELTDLPPGFPLGTTLQEKVDTSGFFLKLWAYRAQDGFRSAPVLLGHGLQWKRTGEIKARFDRQMAWLIAGFLGVFFLILLLAVRRWFLEDRASLKNQRFGSLTDRLSEIPETLDLRDGVFPGPKFDYIVPETFSESAQPGSSSDEPPTAHPFNIQIDHKDIFS